VAYKVQLAYFRPTGKFLTYATCAVDRETLADIWERIHELRRLGQLPGLRPNAGRDLHILVDVVGHPERVLHLVMPPFIGDEDVTPIKVPTGEMQPLVRMPLDEIPRTTTRDVIKPSTDDEVTPVDVPIPEKPEEPKK